MEEIWQDIEGYEGLYQVSNMGRIKSLGRMVKHPKGGLKTVKGKILTPVTCTNGYQQVHLCKNSKVKNFMVHRLVYAAFCGEIPSGMEVNHINEDKTDNRLSNLNLMTPKQNCNWGTRNERSAKSRINHPKRSKQVIGYNKNGDIIVTFPSAKEAGRNGYEPKNISACCRGKRPTHNGLHWKYANGTA